MADHHHRAGATLGIRDRAIALHDRGNRTGIDVAAAAYASRLRRCRCPSSGNFGGIGASTDSRR